MLAATTASATVQVWFDPAGSTASGTNAGFASGTPHKFDWAWLSANVLSATAPLTASDKSVQLNFLPGTHTNVFMTDAFTAATNLPQWSLAIVGTNVGSAVLPEGVVLKLPDHHPAGAGPDDTGYAQAGILAFDNNSLGKGSELNRIVVQNLALDCNWGAQDPYIGPAFPRSYKNFGAHLSARTGRVRQVIVRNYGAHGLAPQSIYDNPGGIEAFPLSVGTTDVGQEPEDGDPRPWVVEDCEVAGFRSLYAGYNTAILAQVRGNVAGAPAQYVTPDVFNTDVTRRTVLVRRSQVRGPASGLGMIGLGTAGGNGFWSRHLTFADNVLLNTGAGFNTDTAQMLELDFTNHLFLDVSALGYLGAIDVTDAHFHTNYNISGNSLRFYGRLAEPAYRDFDIIGFDQKLTRASRVLGGRLTNYAAGVVMQGSASAVTITNNWFTTRAQDAFFTPNPADTANAVFRPVWKLAATEPANFDPGNPYQPGRPASSNVTVLSNFVSSVVFDLTGLTPLGDGGTYTAFTATTAPGHTTNRSALTSLPNFSPTGTVERVVLLLTNRTVSYVTLASNSTSGSPIWKTNTVTTNAVSLGAYEVALGVPVVTNSTTIGVPVRLALQPTPGSGYAGTVPQSGLTVRLSTRFSGGATNADVSATTGGDGIAWFPVTVTNNAAALLQFTAWRDAGAGTNAVFDEWQDAWATAQWAQNAVVWAQAGPDVANDQTQSIARGQFHFYRTGSAAQLASTLAVNFILPTNSLTSPATYGSSGSGDYTLALNATKGPLSWALATNGGIFGGTFTFKTNQTEAVLDVVPRGDTLAETNVVWLTVLAGTNHVVPDAANTLTAPSATVLIFDGPEFALYALDDYTPQLPLYGTNYRFANQTAAYALDNNTTPKIAGGATYLADTYGPAQNFGGWWTTVLPFPLTDFLNDRIAYWQGFGAPTLGISDDGIFVGQLGNNAFRRTTTSGTTLLPHLSTNNLSGAMAINPLGDAGNNVPLGEYSRYIVGASRDAGGTNRPVVWWGGTNIAMDLGGSLLAATGSGEAIAANDYAEIVGQGQINLSGTKVMRGFRSRPSTYFANAALPLLASDQLKPLGSDTDVNQLSVARGVSNGGIAVGSSLTKAAATTNITKTEAVFWPARVGTNANPSAMVLQPLSTNSFQHYDANWINIGGYIGGWSYDITAIYHATLWRGASTNTVPQDLNDQHLAYRGTNWWLETVEAINDKKVMVGNGWYNGKPRGYVLVPLTSGN